MTKAVPSLLAPKNDALELEAEEKETDKSDDNKEEDKKKEEKPEVKIDLEDLETRLTILPPDAGNIDAIMPFDGKLVYQRLPNTGSGERSASCFFGTIRF